MSSLVSNPGRVRSLVLVFTGVVLGSVLVGPAVARVADAATTAAATVHTRAVSCPGSAFAPLSSLTTAWAYDAGLRYGNGAFVCSPALPDRATVTRVRFTLDDDHPSFEETCFLARSPLARGFAVGYQKLADVGGTGVTATPGRVRLSDTTIRFATIDEARFAYWLQCDMPVFGSVGVYGADITYTIVATNG